MLFSPYDLALLRRHAEKRPIQVGLVGAGNLARMIALQLVNPPPPGIRLVAVSNRTVSRATSLLEELSCSCREVSTPGDLMDSIGEGIVAFTGDPKLLASCEGIDVLVDATGSVDFALDIALAAFAHKKHVVLANAELDSTLGPVLRLRADAAGVVYTNIDGDEPGVAMNLIRYARSLGLRAVAAGNLKGMIDRYRNPDTQLEFARKHGQNPRIITSFADGTKLAMEAAILANATGFRVGQPGMFGPSCRHVREIAALLPAEKMLEHGLVDYALGAEPHTGAFVVVWESQPSRQRWLQYLKMGDGPFYVLYTPYHLPHIQIIASIARAVGCQDATIAAQAAPVCQVVCRAKYDLAPGTILDGPGGFTCYGQIENWASVAAHSRGLPIALSAGSSLQRAIVRDERICVGDVSRAEDSLALNLWLEMETMPTLGPTP